MKIEVTNEGGVVTVKLDGWLDTASAPELGAEVEKLNEAKELVLDFEKVEYMASSGLRQVLASNKKAKELGAEFSVINVGNETMSVFEMTGIDKKLNIKAK